MSENYPYYREKRAARLPEVPADLTLPRRARQDSPQGYRPGENLVHAVNAALLLSQPLLLTGEAGTGKTQLAHSLNWQIGFKNNSPFIFETKSTSTARDLFYSYDTVGRFHAAQTRQGSQDNRDYITYNALGKAILFANPKSAVRDFLPNENKANEKSSVADENDLFMLTPDDEWQRRSVVLIDEIDKAPRDFPNDILNEIERMFFRVAELGNRAIEVKDEKFRPIIVLTSNSEKNLPDAFLRRCVYYNIEFPKENYLKEIVDERLGEAAATPRGAGEFRWYDVLIELFENLRDSNQLIKKPATAELLGWLTAIRRLLEYYEVPTDDLQRKTYLKSPAGEETIINPTLCVLLKNADDVINAKPTIEKWRQSR